MSPTKFQITANAAISSMHMITWHPHPAKMALSGFKLALFEPQ
jgi:hypothetical protein